MTVLHDAATILRKQGISQLLSSGAIFLTERLPLPRRDAEYNGVTVCAGSPLYRILPVSASRPTYEDGIVSAIREHVRPNDGVVVVGGGWGVTTVWAARAADDGGSVLTLEGAEHCVQRTRQTVARNGVDDTVEVQHAVVGPKVSLHGAENGAERLSATELKDCNVLLLDCEGSEMQILEEMDANPRVVVVETHGMYDAPPEKVRTILQRRGYEITRSVVADSSKANFCQEHGVMVLTAVRHST